MKKMPTLFVRKFDEENTNGTPKHGSKFTITAQVTPGCEWVMNGEGVATRKWDGTCVLIQGRVVFKRYDAKRGKIPPQGFRPAQFEPDPITGHWPGWLDIQDYPDHWIIEAVRNSANGDLNNLKDGTYEAIGPKINGNRDNRLVHSLERHGNHVFNSISNVPLIFEEIQYHLFINDCEGIVFHHPDGRMCKIKRSDFGLKW